jgi:hypothetical protein
MVSGPAPRCGLPPTRSPSARDAAPRPPERSTACHCDLDCPAIADHSVPLSAADPRSERRSNHGQMIFEALSAYREPGADLVFRGQVFTFGCELGFCGLVGGSPTGKRAAATGFCPVQVSLFWPGLASMICRVRSWSSVSRARIFFALSNRGCQAASSASVRRRVTVFPPILRVHSA